MSQLSGTLREAADKNAELLSELSVTDYARSSLGQNVSYIVDLKAQIASTDEELARLHKITEDEKKDHIRYRDSNVKRWAHKLGGSKGKAKFESRSEKEEREFLDAWQAERSAKESRDELAAALAGAEKDHSHLDSEAKRHDKAQAALDALYQSIFDGPTPDVPGEDQMESNLQQAKQHFDQSQAQTGTENMALQALQRADQTLFKAAKYMEDALDMSRADMFGGGTFVDMMERDALANAQNHVNMTLRHMEEARRIQPAVEQLNEINIDHGHFFSDVMFDNIFSDMDQHDRIKNSNAQLHNAIGHLKSQLDQQASRQKSADAGVRNAAANLEGTRKELQRIRAQAFEMVNGAKGTAPPPYAS
ncbi:unnamed protein product [Zymoseptoria tritici ST99CH_1A5]|uniref:Uncharacterized protein n=1 Tax=Zymoseptoria tritici ST99CH_1A5 TaxID=1276529 RepID=A0A1Y6LBJ0_ZYMTR|nr:unnamed protein product [Zymoseptoria tritici ST99CH_1A5]